MKRMRLLVILLGMWAVSVYGDEAQPQVDTIDIFEAVRIAEGLLFNEPHLADSYANRDIELARAIKYTTSRLGSRVGGTIQEFDLDTGEFMSEYPASETEYNRRLRKKLAGRIYWLVDFDYTEYVLGRDIIYYIDAETSELIE